ncbi:MAG TPA: PQQ-dependent sugar dehydrogenase [Vicinamibacterales bacterium]|nr:PQQ-dependent sugar dehydrogenase [Vicinamibacterales bacterium]
MAVTRSRAAFWTFAAAAAITYAALQPAGTHAAAPTMLDRTLGVRTVASGFVTPVSLAFIGLDDMLVLEKNTGRVQRVSGTGPSQTIKIETVLDLAVNSASERGLLGIALHPAFPANPGVYLYWTCRSVAPPTDPFRPDEQRCSESPMLGADSGNILEVPLLGNRVDRFVWTGTQLVFDRNLIMLHAFQNDGAPDPPGQGDAAQPPAGNHNGGVIRFGPDGKLYIIIGDNGRRGQLQNLADGPTPPTADDQFGGPEPDDAHLTGVILRVNDDGSTPADNPFLAAGAAIGGEVGANVQKIFAYGIRNSFGMDFDPVSGRMWVQENGDDSFDEIHRVDAGLNSGWVQFIGPVGRIAEFKSIETTLGARTLQQLRWPPTNIADTPEDALARLFMLPGAHYRDPDFSWKFAVAPAGLGFLSSSALGPQYAGDLFVGAARTTLTGGYLFRFNLTGNRRGIAIDDPRLADHVADNTAKFDITESETILAGRDFGIGTDIRTGPNGNLFVVSLSNGAIYEVFRAR